MKEELIEQIDQEISENIKKIMALESESDAVGKKRILSRFYTTALFGIIPAIIATLVASKLIAIGTLSVGVGTIASCVVTGIISLINYHLYQKKFDFAGAFAKYNVRGREKQLAEREYDLVEQKRILEIKTNALTKLSDSLRNGELTLKNIGLSDEQLEKEYQKSLEHLEGIAKVNYIHDCFFEFEQKTRSKFKSFLNGFVLGSISAIVMLVAPGLIAGVSNYVFQIVTATLALITGITFGSVAAHNTGNLEEIYSSKKGEISQFDPTYDGATRSVAIDGLTRSAMKSYATSRVNLESKSLPLVEENKDDVQENVNQEATPSIDEVVMLTKKY